ncbi:hypothetical protein [Mangrovimonas futianensis]|uniref:hypothetical protein n=1 Tax=Mangrovimonas futianensis TaxID=2895523 RepID=UPI001E485296|nr:hypothetical protein [Mangrovimonas futianensis]MCF1193925.1 hypothetical protein [Mangrovimonas futianensis]
MIFYSLQSCKEGSNTPLKKEATAKEPQEKIDKSLFLYFDGTFEKDDEFSVYYLTVEDTQIKPKNAIIKKVKGSSKKQRIEFHFPNEIIPTRIFFKLGNNLNQKIIVHEVILVQNKKEVHISDSLFYNYFNPNKAIVYDKSNYTITIDSSNKGNEPMIYSRVPLEDKLDLEFEW